MTDSTKARAQLWLLLVYSVPREPSASRVYVWRKLKRLGAVALQDAVWVLPATGRTREQFRWLAAEIRDLRGEATLWESTALAGDERALIERVQADLNTACREVLSALKRKNRDLAALSRRYQQLRAQDYFGSALGKQVRAALIAARGASR